MKLTLNMQGNSKKKKDENTDENKEKELSEQMPDMSKSMSYMMPIMAVSISLVAPLGLGLYWLVNNVLMIGERMLLNKFIKDEEEEA